MSKDSKECFMQATAATTTYSTNRLFDQDMMRALRKKSSLPAQTVEIDSELTSRGQRNYRNVFEPLNVTRKVMSIRAPYNRSNKHTRLQDQSHKHATVIDRFMQTRVPPRDRGRAEWTPRDTQLEARDSFKAKKPKIVDPTLALPKCDAGKATSWVSNYTKQCK